MELIVFRNDGLRQASTATCADARNRYFDLMLSERLAKKSPTPEVRTASHLSIIYGNSQSVVTARYYA